MTNLNREFCFAVKAARRESGLSQSVLAAEIGCKQSALSMFEQGDGTKLSDEAVKKLSAKFGIELPKEESAAPAAAMPAPRGFGGLAPRPLGAVHRGFCPNPHCPTNANVYEVDGERFAVPDREAADPVGGKFCAMCAEVLEKRCPNCGAHIHKGAVCSHCGTKYVAIE